MEGSNKKNKMTDEQKRERQRIYWKKWYNEKGKTDEKYLKNRKTLTTKYRNVEISKLQNELKSYKNHFGEIPTV